MARPLWRRQPTSARLRQRADQHRDRIEVDGSAGTVVGIDLRYTVLDAADRWILVPNSTLLSNSVVVYRAAGGPPKS